MSALCCSKSFIRFQGEMKAQDKFSFKISKMTYLRSWKCLKLPKIYQNRLNWINSKLATKTTTLLREKCPYSELLWSVFSCIPNEYGELLRVYQHLVRKRENTDQNNSEYGHFLRSALHSWYSYIQTILANYYAVIIKGV